MASQTHQITFNEFVRQRQAESGSSVPRNQKGKGSLVGVTPVTPTCYQVLSKSYDMSSYRVYVRSDQVAMRLADRCAVQRFGLKAKTNFDYTRAELIQMLADIKQDVALNIQHKRFTVSFKAFQPREVRQPTQNMNASEPDVSESIDAEVDEESM